MSNDINNNFLNQDFEEATDEVFEEVEAGQEVGEDQTGGILHEAIKRIEQAKLYETLLKHDLFGAGSARPEIIHAVQAELKQFILTRLNVLLGITPEKAVVAASQEFTPEQADALRALADRVISKNGGAPTNPTVTPVAAPTPPAPTIARAVAAQPTIRPVGGSAPVQSQPTAPIQRPKAVRRRNPKSENVSAVSVETTDGRILKVNKDYSQAVAPTAPKPMPFPSNAQINAINAQHVGNTESVFSSATSGLGALLNKAVQLSQAKNANVREDKS